jgi:heme/copper-type cytochrome/quinol oxidase subunit 2
MSDPELRHFTARRGFIAAAGFGMVGVYFLWAGYGAAPLGFGRAHAPAEDGGGHAPEPSAAGHAGHAGHAGPRGGMSSEEFRSLTKAFVEQNRLADGSVRPGGPMQDHPMHGAGAAAHGATAPAGPVDVYLMAYQWGYTPSILRLETGVPYRFRMMAVDVAHGASLQLGRAGRIVRLRPGMLVEQELKFSQAGEYLLYCTVYCGLAHDRMQGRLIVGEGRA